MFGRRQMGMRRRRTIRAPIVSYKHQRAEDVTYVGAGSNHQFNIINVIGPGEPSTPTDVAAGHKVYGVNISLNFIHPSGSGTDTPKWMVVYLRADQSIATLFAATNAADWSNIGLSNARNQVIKSFMSVIGTEDSGPRIYNIRVKLPRIYQRLREGDRLVIIFNAVTAGPLSIGVRYKEFS